MLPDCRDAIADKHQWPTDCKRAAEVQNELAGRVRLCPLDSDIRTVGAVDCAFVGKRFAYTHIIAGVVVVDIAAGTVIERRSAECPVTFPYVPGYLSFREAPAAIEAIENLSALPGVLLIDGQGLAHPRRFGLACHIGVLTDLPAIGCAKSLLVGKTESDLPPEKGSSVSLEHNGDVVGAVVRTRDNVKPVYVSVGHRATVADSVDLVLSLCSRYRLPDPARMAHNYVTGLRHG